MDVRTKETLKHMNTTKVSFKEAIEKFNDNYTIMIEFEGQVFETNKKADVKLANFPNGKYYVVKPYDTDKVIVTRHLGVAEWFRKYKGINAPVVAAARPRDVKGKIIYTSGINLGILNYAKGAYVVKVNRLEDVDFDYLSADELNNHDPRLTWVSSTEVNIDLNSDIKKATPVYLTTNETYKIGDVNNVTVTC